MNGNIEAAFIGRVGSDPELRTSQAGKPWMKLIVAVGSDDATQWVKVVAFGARAEALAGTLLKGDRAYVEGTIRLETWTDKEGKARSGLSLSAWKVEKLAQIGRNKPKAKPLPEGDHSAPLSTEQPRRVAFDDEIPF
jgi:single-strand DNA-binding protein